MQPNDVENQKGHYCQKSMVLAPLWLLVDDM